MTNLRVIADKSPFEVELEADRRHVPILVDQFGLSNAKGVATPGIAPTVVELEKSLVAPKLNRQEHKSYRSGVMRAQYLAVDRPDLPFATKECARFMHEPSQFHLQRFKHMVKYLIGVHVHCDPRLRSLVIQGIFLKPLVTILIHIWVMKKNVYDHSKKHEVADDV